MSSSQSTVETTTSADGTVLGYHRFGAGDPIVLVHGAISTADAWLPVAQALAADHTVYAHDRRGRGASGDAERYDLGTEADDIEAILAVARADTGAEPALLGHSYGAIATLEAARRGAAISSLVLYEPPLPVDGPTAGVHLVDYAAAVEADDRDGAMRIATKHFLRLSEEETEELAATPLWAQFRELVPTWTRELAAIDASAPQIPEYATLAVRTLLLTGSESPSNLHRAIERLESTLPNVTRVDLVGHGHFANLLDPVGVAAHIHSFLSARPAE
ncbi:MAG: alpha/beta hydrolase [Gordonia sp. (in: high G+C Gram-positive bacteria)]